MSTQIKWRKGVGSRNFGPSNVGVVAFRLHHQVLWRLFSPLVGQDVLCGHRDIGFVPLVHDHKRMLVHIVAFVVDAAQADCLLVRFDVGARQSAVFAFVPVILICNGWQRCFVVRVRIVVDCFTQPVLLVHAHVLVSGREVRSLREFLLC